MLWFNMKKQTENVLPTYEQRILLLESELRKLKSENLGFATDIDMIRNKVLRKIQFKKEIEADEEPNWGGIPVQ
jgi:hypothetical protein